MRRPNRLVLLAGGLLVLGSVTACGDPVAARPTAGGASSPTTVATPTPTPTVDVPDRPRFDTPLETFNVDVAMASWHAPESPEGRRWTAHVTACMAAQGYEWEHVPVPGSVDLSEDTFDGAYVLEHAYGRVEEARTRARLAQTPPPDPRAGWTQEQRDAYDWALDGGYLPGRDMDQDAWVDGCTGIANREVYGQERDGVTMQTDHAWQEWVGFEDDLFAMYRAADASVVPDALAAWKECMAAAGFPETGDLTDVLDVARLLDPRIDGARDAAAAAGREEAFADSPELTAVGEYEVALARADLLGCRAGYDRTRHEARLAAEEAFVAERAAEVDGWKAYRLAQVPALP